MYYPYLREKKYELKALREFSAEHPLQATITPILEPVKGQPNALAMAMDEMLDNGLRFALILNPSDGDFKHATVHFDMWEQHKRLNVDRTSWIPAFLYKGNNASEIINALEDKHLQNVMIIFRSCMDIDDANAWSVVRDERVEYIVNAFGNTVSRRLKAQLADLGKQIIRLDDCFESKVRNADYALEPDVAFSEEPFYYREDGFHGYSDYTTLPKEFVEGGMLPYALAIHFSYLRNNDQVFVHHFVSDSNRTNSDVRGKFREAAMKIEPFFAGRKRTAAVQEMIEKANDPDGYPGLGYIKKLSIKNHLELIMSLNA